ncbi:hypothetical protein E0Z10_g380 [Xylaria hypoxylon]|uniref:Branched-chain-amino-acid aminotransferase n=1 Tax=Xylaria hypoxylon TaxID=37992 RepID=A0A4Z0Z9C4_9PEZI|nr:hypothetical protein E0Z10_g380 [Xylaria hypoxylon]
MSTAQLQDNGYGQGQQSLIASNITYNFTTEPRAVPDEAIASSGKESICTDHIIVAEWTKADGWSNPELKPYGPLSLLPTSSCLHYAFQCFEGMKVYRGYDERISLPTAEPAELLKLIKDLVSIDGPKWLPKSRPGSFMYLRPTMIGTQPLLGVQTPRKAMLYIVMSFMGRLDNIPGGMRLETSPDDMVRAWTGGFGHAKIGANYGPNFFVVWKRQDGKTELRTAPLDDKIILDGVTRQSCLDLARLRLGDDLVVTECRFNIQELIEANNLGRLLEIFSCGTAYAIGPISQIVHRGHEINIPTGALEGGGKVTNQIRDWLVEIIYGTVNHEWGVVVVEKCKQ